MMTKNKDQESKPVQLQFDFESGEIVDYIPEEEEING